MRALREAIAPPARTQTVTAAGWLRRAASALAEHPELMREARTVRGFGGGGHWMASALSAARGDCVAPRDPRFVALGIGKYGLCLLAAFAVAPVSLGALGTAGAIACGLLAFYAVEARHVFAFPAAIDYGRRRAAASRALHRRAGGTVTILTRVLPIAAFMLFGGIGNRRPRWSFAVGCMAIVLWYESLRRREDSTPPVLEIGGSAPLSIRRVGARGPHATRLIYASDLHLGAWGASRAMRDLQRIVVRERPDAVLLGGDLLDSRRAMHELGAWIRRLSRWTIVAAVPGNHDARSLARIAAIVRDSGGRWLPDGPLHFEGLRIDGTPSRAPHARRLLCAHHPAVFETAAALGYDFVMAGHLHGGQAILFDFHGRHYPGALHSRWTGPEFARARSTMWVSRGLADTLPIRFRCPREVLVAAL